MQMSTKDPHDACSSIIDMMLFPLASFSELETLIVEENALAVFTNKEAALACSPSLFVISRFF